MRNARLWKRLSPYLYLLPCALIMLVMLGFPIGYNIGISFFKWRLQSVERPFILFDNYLRILMKPEFLKVVGVTLLWTGLGILLQMLAGILMALFVDALRRGRKYMRVIMLLPWVIPGVVTALMWKWMLQADVGVVNALLMRFGLTGQNILFLSDPNLAIFSLILVNTWKAAPFWFLMVTASLQDKPMDQIESARLDGASSLGTLRHVILPHLSPVIASTGVLTTIWTLNYFDLIWVTTKGGPLSSTSTLPIYTYRLAFEFNNFGESAAMAVISLILVSLVCVPYVRKMFAGLRQEGVL